MPRTLRSQVYDRKAMLRCCLIERCCRVCGGPPGSAHHLIPRGGPHYGDDVLANLVCLCGSGTTGCHGKVENHDEDTCAKLGLHLTRANLAYVTGHLGVEPGLEFLRRRYSYGGTA